MTDEPATETGAAVDGLVAAVHADLDKACGLLTEAAALFSALAREAPGVNGLATRANGWRDRLETMIAEAEKEAADVERKFAGAPPREPIRAHLDEDHAAKVLAARAATTEPEE